MSQYSLPLKENHVALWNWLSEHPEKCKIDWPGWKTIDRLNIEHSCNRCFACDVVVGNCEENPCPIGDCSDYEHPYVKYGRSVDPDDRAKYAAQVRDAWKEGGSECEPE